MLHENPAFPPWVQCLPYLKLVGKLRGFSEEHATGQAKYLLNTFDLDDKYYAYVNKLSAGQRQKFGLCQAVIGLPPLIFLDEPTANLDAHARIQVLDFLSTITREFDLTIVIMSHILSDLERYCDNIAIIHNGEIRYKNSVAKILEDVDITQFTLRSEKLTDDKIRSLLTNESSLEITNKGNDLVVSVHNNDQRRELDELIDNHRISKFPYRTKLETLFLEYTDMELV